MPEQNTLLTNAENALNEQLLASGSTDVVVVNGDTIALNGSITLNPKTFFEAIDLAEAAAGFPDSLSDVADLQLEAFSVNAAGRVAFRLSLQASNDSKWVIIPGLIEAEQFSLDGIVDQGAIGPPMTATVDVDLKIAGLEVTTSINLPEMDFSAAASDEGDAMTAGDLLNAIGLEDAGFGNLRLNGVALSGSALNKFAFFAIDIADPWSLDGASIDLAITGIALELIYIGGEEGSVTGSLTGQAVINNIIFNVGAIYDGPEAGWTFAGSVENLTGIADPVGSILAAFGLSGSPLSDFTVHRIDLTFNSLSKDFRFGFDGQVALDGVNARLVAEAALIKQPGSGYAKFFSGTLTLGEGTKEKIFDLVFDQNGDGATLVGTFRNSGGQSLSLMDLATSVTSNQGNQRSAVEKDLDFSIKDALFAYQTGGKFLFAIDMDFGLELSGLGSLPLIGKALPKDLSLSLAFQPVISSRGPRAPEIDAVQGLIPEGGPVLPENLTGGFQFLTALNVAGNRHVLDLGLGDNDANDAVGSTNEVKPEVSGANSATEVAPRNVKFVDIEKSFGPLHIGKVGVSLRRGREKEIGLIVDGAISIAGLTLSLDGLGAVYNMNSQDLQFFLSGLGIEFKRGPVEIAGAFLNLGNDFAGKVRIATAKFEITALGAMAMVKDQPALFLYGMLDYPLGGPAFFFIEGLAIGFGYNRSFTPPAIDAVRQFPLIQDAIDNVPIPADADPKDTATNQLRRLGQYIQPSLGEYFVTAGIKFTSFKLLNSFILVTASFGKAFELNIIGVSTYQNPPEIGAGIPPLARIEMNLLGRFAPAEGFLGVQAQLTDRSFILSNLCKITGGFAFFTWFDGPHAGDFVLSVGGYHPRFSKPDHYPVVPRLSLSYQITEDIHLKGSLYFALTPSTLMAGGSIDATADIGPVAAWFHTSLDMLISWEPYHYDFEVDLRIGARFLGQEFEVGAHVEIWGPEFSGMAEVDIGIKTFEIEFGESNSRGPTPIDWDPFKSAFLPEDNQICSARIVEGVVYEIEREVDGEKINIPVLNPKDLKLETNAMIPARSGTLNENFSLTGTAEPFGVAPMNVANLAQSEHKIAILREDTAGTFSPVNDDDFQVLPVIKKFPKGMWGQSVSVDMNAGMFNAIAGYTISVDENKRARPGTSRTFRRSEFDQEPPTEHTLAEHDETADRLHFTATAQPDDARRAQLVTQLTASITRRNTALAALGFEPAEAVSLSDQFTESFVIPPQVVGIDTPTT